MQPISFLPLLLPHHLTSLSLHLSQVLHLHLHLPSSNQTKQHNTIFAFYYTNSSSSSMAFELKSLSLSFLCLLLLLQLSDGFNGSEKTLSLVATLKENPNRKLLMVVNGVEAKEGFFKIQGKKKMKSRGGEEGWDQQLRAAPLGPDPLHHHGADPKKPTTP